MPETVPDKTKVRFLKSHGAFNPGEIATFPKEGADKLIKKGYCTVELSAAETRAAKAKAVEHLKEKKTAPEKTDPADPADSGEALSYPELKDLAKAKADAAGVDLAEAAGGLKAEQLQAYLDAE